VKLHLRWAWKWTLKWRYTIVRSGTVDFGNGHEIQACDVSETGKVVPAIPTSQEQHHHFLILKFPVTVHEDAGIADNVNCFTPISYHISTLADQNPVQVRRSLTTKPCYKLLPQQLLVRVSHFLHLIKH